ncbi:MAG: hypothetical protein U0936_26715 [Planctomycetaceae bacterium]
MRIAACVLCIVGIWIEKGMGLIIPGFIPSTLHEIVEYTPSLVEWKVTAGIWLGFVLLTVLRLAIATVFTVEKPKHHDKRRFQSEQVPYRIKLKPEFLPQMVNHRIFEGFHKRIRHDALLQERTSPQRIRRTANPGNESRSGSLTRLVRKH